MPEIDGNTHVVLPMKQILGIVVSLLVGGGVILWTVLSFTIGGLREDIGGLREDVSAIRTDIGKLQESALAAPSKLSDAQIALTKDISGLRVDLESIRGDLKVMKLSIDDLGARIDNFAKQPKDKK
jgi:hypothetical protein